MGSYGVLRPPDDPQSQSPYGMIGDITDRAVADAVTPVPADPQQLSDRQAPEPQPVGPPQTAAAEADPLSPRTAAPYEPQPTVADPSKQRFHDTLRDFGQARQSVLSDIVRLNPHDPNYASQLANLHEHQGMLREEEARYKQEHPWGTIESAHPGVLGKIGHAFGNIGNVVGNATLGAQNMSAIPGTRANLQSEVAAGEGEEQASEKEQQQLTSGEAALGKAEAAGAQAEARKTAAEAQGKKADVAQQHENTVEQNLPNQLGAAWQEALDHGQEPLQSPKVQQAISAMQQTGKQGLSKLQHVAGTVNGKPAFADFDPTSGQFLDPQSHQPIPGFQPPPTFAQTGNFQPIQVVTPQGQITPGAFNTRTGQTSLPQQGANVPIPKDIQGELNKEMQSARDADTRLKIMQQNYQAALKGDQQAMVSLVANHIGMTLGMQKGARINQAVWNEAVASRPWMQGIAAKFDDNGYLSGVTLTPPQMKQMLDLAEERRIAQWQQVKAFGDNNGLQVAVPSLAEKGGATEGSSAPKPPGPPQQGMKWQHRTVNGKVQWRQVQQ